MKILYLETSSKNCSVAISDGEKLLCSTEEVSENYKLIPKNGVYIVSAIVNSQTIFGMMNIGTNPTVGGQTQTIEANFLDFSDDLYDKKLKIELLLPVNDEGRCKKFVPWIKVFLH